MLTCMQIEREICIYIYIHLHRERERERRGTQTCGRISHCGPKDPEKKASTPPAEAEELQAAHQIAEEVVALHGRSDLRGFGCARPSSL